MHTTTTQQLTSFESLLSKLYKNPVVTFNAVYSCREPNHIKLALDYLVDNSANQPLAIDQQFIINCAWIPRSKAPPIITFSLQIDGVICSYTPLRNVHGFGFIRLLNGYYDRFMTKPPTGIMS